MPWVDGPTGKEGYGRRAGNRHLHCSLPYLPTQQKQNTEREARLKESRAESRRWNERVDESTCRLVIVETMNYLGK